MDAVEASASRIRRSCRRSGGLPRCRSLAVVVGHAVRHHARRVEVRRAAGRRHRAGVPSCGVRSLLRDDIAAGSRESLPPPSFPAGARRDANSRWSLPRVIAVGSRTFRFAGSSSASFAPRNSHFYTPYVDECAKVKASNAWIYEGVAFALTLPAGTSFGAARALRDCSRYIGRTTISREARPTIDTPSIRRLWTRWSAQGSWRASWPRASSRASRRRTESCARARRCGAAICSGHAFDPTPPLRSLLPLRARRPRGVCLLHDAHRHALRHRHEARDRPLWSSGALASVRVPGEASGGSPRGTRDLASRMPSDFAGHFSIRSVTKSFTVTLILELVREGAITLDDRLSRFVPGIPNGDLITLADLAGNQSGLADYCSRPRSSPRSAPTSSARSRSRSS